MTEIFNKVANAKLAAQGRGPTRFATALFGAASGGVWVGGRIVLDAKTLTFSANKMNRAVQKRTLDFSVAVDNISGAKIIGGFGTKIISVDIVNDEPFLFRCSRAHQVLGQLQAAVS